MLNIMLSIIIGIFAGIITGLIPGIHINLVSALLVSSAAAFSNIPLLYFVLFIVSMSITHTFLDSIPSIYLGVPDPDMALSILPAHRMLLQGKGFLALKYTLYGSIAGLLISVILSPLLIFGIPLLYSLIKNYLGYIILFFISIIFLKDKKRFLKNLFIFILAGIFGIIALDINLNQPMFHLFTGLFGISNLVLSLKTSKITKQKFESIIIKAKHKLSVFIATIVGIVAAFLPGMGSSQSAVLGMSLMKNKDSEDPSIFLSFIGGINTVNMFVSLITFYTINKARNGSVVAVKEIVGAITFSNLLILIAASLFVGGIAILLGTNIAKVFSKFVEKINYKMLILSIITSITILSFVFDNFLGLIIIVLGTFLGILTSKLEVAKSYLMGCLLLQVLVFLL